MKKDIVSMVKDFLLVKGQITPQIFYEATKAIGKARVFIIGTLVHSADTDTEKLFEDINNIDEVYCSEGCHEEITTGLKKLNKRTKVEKISFYRCFSGSEYGHRLSVRGLSKRNRTEFKIITSVSHPSEEEYIGLLTFFDGFLTEKDNVADVKINLGLYESGRCVSTDTYNILITPVGNIGMRETNDFDDFKRNEEAVNESVWEGIDSLIS